MSPQSNNNISGCSLRNSFTNVASTYESAFIIIPVTFLIDRFQAAMHITGLQKNQLFILLPKMQKKK